MIQLNDKQAKYYEAVKWLISSNNRGTGRSTLLAKAYIAEAIENRDQWIHVNDHSDTFAGDRYLFQLVKT